MIQTSVIQNSHICVHVHPQLFKVSIIQTKLFGPLDFELSRFHCILPTLCRLGKNISRHFKIVFLTFSRK